MEHTARTPLFTRDPVLRDWLVSCFEVLSDCRRQRELAERCERRLIATMSTRTGVPAALVEAVSRANLVPAHPANGAGDGLRTRFGQDFLGG